MRFALMPSDFYCQWRSGWRRCSHIHILACKTHCESPDSGFRCSLICYSYTPQYTLGARSTWRARIVPRCKTRARRRAPHYYLRKLELMIITVKERERTSCAESCSLGSQLDEEENERAERIECHCLSQPLLFYIFVIIYVVLAPTKRRAKL